MKQLLEGAKFGFVLMLPIVIVEVGKSLGFDRLVLGATLAAWAPLAGLLLAKADLAIERKHLPF